MEEWEGEKGKGMEEQDKAAKDKAWKTSQATALGGRGFRFTATPAEDVPHSVPFFFSQPVNHCHLNTTLSPTSPPPRPPDKPGPASIFKAPLLQWTAPNDPPSSAPFSPPKSSLLLLPSSIFHLYFHP